ncbi:MAG: efflux RND transporter periplasmic adaptor subunit [Nitrospira sp.]|nr:efflux RND transporter periplasmic adaptor subunit [Nitrospira sp.]MBS0173140.1 efflux RND transporter periplasmic adaptor subunit [Nitrospira sp.]MCW5779556.1 efflux RND transporter periplasmic adaptor subunit [Nitrospira sp.]HNL87485.1 efflux RND transporter periplasmic adaptor subunit [Nitrospira sp.]
MMDSNRAGFRPHRRGGVVRLLAGRCLLLAAVLTAAAGCDRDPASLPPPDKPTDKAANGIVHLTEAEIARAGIEVLPVQKAPFTLHREFPATIHANENELAEVTTLIRGRVVEVLVDVGRDVKKGERLALLDSADLGMAEGAYLKAAARQHEAQLAHERAANLHEHRAISLAELQRREAEMKTAQADAREASHRLKLLGVPDQDIQRLERERTIRSDVAIRAPFAGRVILRNITRGEVVETSRNCFTIADLSDVWVVASVPEKDVRFIHPNETVHVVVAAYPHGVYSGRMTYISDVLDQATRTMRIRVTVPNPDRALKPEMFAMVRIDAAPQPDALAVPLAAVQQDGGDKVLFVRQPERRFELRRVRLGDEQDGNVIVLEGLREGEDVVVKGAFAIKSELDIHKIEPTQ